MMKGRLLLAIVALTEICHAGASPQPSCSDMCPLWGVRVVDGDTVVARGQSMVIRLSGIDAPEKAHGLSKPGQPFAQAAQRRLAGLVMGQQEVIARCYDTDRYGRRVCDLVVAGHSVSYMLVSEGLAWANQAAGGRFLRSEQLLQAQKRARHERRGLWSMPDPQAPWSWRKNCWVEGRCQR